MIIVMQTQATDAQVGAVVDAIEKAGCQAHIDRGQERVIVGVRTGRHDLQRETFQILPGVAEVVRVSKPYKLASREFHPSPTVFDVGGVTVGGTKIVVMAGPCSVESEEQIASTARAVKKAGATILRGGAFKPRSSPYAFQGLGQQGLVMLAEAGREVGLPVVTEVLKADAIDIVAKYADIIQIGARNMQNYDLLRDVASVGRPVLLKRGMAATIDDLLMSAEYLLSGGCDHVMLCERGIRTFESATRNTLDISAVPVAKMLSHLPVIIDPSHAAGRWEFVTALGLAAVAAGADGLIVEVHPQPEVALSDGQQSLTPKRFEAMVDQCRRV
ncbi:MAG: 3-deoxy-7-phosphoheptulonate synthase, partial [Myxococcota bacterium]